MHIIHRGIKPFLGYGVRWFWTKTVWEWCAKSSPLLLPWGTENTGLSESRCGRHKYLALIGTLGQCCLMLIQIPLICF